MPFFAGEEVANDVDQDLDLLVAFLLVFEVGSHVEGFSLLAAVANACTFGPNFVLVVC